MSLSSLSLATEGFLPNLTPLCVATQGFMCDVEENLSRGVKKKKVKLIRAMDLPYIKAEKLVKQMILDDTEAVVQDSGDFVINAQAPKAVSGASLEAGAPALQDITDSVDREIAHLMRLGEIRRHAQVQRIHAKEMGLFFDDMGVMMIIMMDESDGK